MREIAVLTPDPADVSYAGSWPIVLSRIGAALGGVGVRVVPVPWTGHVDAAGALLDYPLVLPLLAWGYHLDHARWLRGCRTWNIEGVRMANSAAVLGWNSDKRYLRRLAEHGVSIPLTTFCDRVDAGMVERVFADTAEDMLIIKPTVSGGAWETLRVRRGEALCGAPHGPAMLQPYLPSIETVGETSLVFFDGVFSHAVNKRPAAGDFRVQQQHGGRYTAVQAVPEEALALARKVLEAIGAPLLYARIDLVPGADGRWLLMEAELIEPDLYLQVVHGAGAAFAAAVARALGTATAPG